MSSEVFWTILMVGAALVLGVGGALWSWYQQKKRREALAALAKGLGMSFDPSHDRSHDDEYAHFEIFRRGRSRVAHNTMWGRLPINGREYPAKMGDFRYKVTRSSGKSRSTRTYRFSYLILHLPFANVPDLLIRREGLFDKLAGVVGFDDIDFESAEFSRRFHVKSKDKRFAYDVVTPAMMEFLLHAPGPSVDIEHGRLCLADGKTRWRVEQFEESLAWATRFLSLWPEHVLADLERRGAAS